MDFSEEKEEPYSWRPPPPRKRSSGCSSCAWKLLIFALFVVTCLAFLHEQGIVNLRQFGYLDRFKRPTSAENWIGYLGSNRTYQSPNFTPRRLGRPSAIVLHCTEGPHALSAIRHFENPASKVSAHYIIDKDGTLFQMVDERHQAWHCRGANAHTIGIEIAALMHERITPAQTGTLIALLHDLTTRYPISRDRITGHDFTPGYPNTTSCPDMLFGGNKPEHLKAWLDLNFPRE